MKLIDYINSIEINKGGFCIDGILKQYGNPAIFNADVNGEQKTIDLMDSGKPLPYISGECLTNGLFQHRMRNNPKNAVDQKKICKSDLEELFNIFKEHHVHYRGGIIASSTPCSSTKSLRVSTTFQNKNSEFGITSNDRLGIMADEGKNDYPRKQYLYYNCEFIFNAYLSLDDFHPSKNGLILKLCEKADELNDKEFSESVKLWIDTSYFIKSNQIHKEEIKKDIMNKMRTYEHPVHKRYNSWLIFTEEIKITDINNMSDLIKYLNERRSKRDFF